MSRALFLWKKKGKCALPKESTKKNIKQEQLFLRLLLAFFGVVILAFGAAILNAAQVGVDAYSANNLGMSRALGMSLGNFQLLLNLLFFLLILVFNRKNLGWGTLINMVLVGYFIQFFNSLLAPLMETPGIVIKLCGLLIGVLLFTMGISLYLGADLGAGIYDGITPMILKYTHWPFVPVRVAQDVFFVVTALVFHGPVGIGTVINAFFTGPFIHFWDRVLTAPLIEKITNPAKISEKITKPEKN